MADNINIKGPTAKPSALGAALPQAGDIASKLQRYLTGKGVSAKKAAKILAGVIDDFLEEEATSEADEADEIIEQLQNAGVQGKTPEEIADALAEMLDSGGSRTAAQLEQVLRERIDARLGESSE